MNTSKQSQELVIDADNSSIILRPKEVWDYRELLFFLVWRQIIVRYKQTVVGIIWVLIQPIATMVVMTLVFNVFLDVESGDIPYPIFVLSALIFWRYFSSALTNGGQSLVSNAVLISKIYFPRIIIPISACISPIVDFLLSLVVLILFMPLFGIMPSARIIFVPLLIIVIILTALSVSLWLAALNVRFRDVAQLIPFIVQIWMYLVPVMYPIERVPESLRTVYSLNPMVGVIESARWIFFEQNQTPDFTPMLIGIAVTVVLLIGGLMFFNRVERSFADII